MLSNYYFCSDISIVVGFPVPTGPPAGVTASSTDSTSVMITWQPPILEQQNGIITSYHISIIEVETEQEWSFVTDPVNTAYIVSDLHPFYYYNCSIAAYTNGFGPSAHYVTQTLPDGNYIYHQCQMI